MKSLGVHRLDRRPGESLNEALMRDRAQRAEGQRNLLLLAVLLLGSLLVGLGFHYHGQVAYCMEYGTVP